MTNNNVLSNIEGVFVGGRLEDYTVETFTII
jgi:hypothetical protein